MSLCQKNIFKSIFDEWNQAIQRFLQARRISSEDAADLTQECFLRLWKNCEKVSQEAASSYLFKLAQNISIDHFRKQKVRLKYSGEQVSFNEKKDGQYLMEMAEFKVRLEQAMDGMSEASRVVFVMHRMEDYTYKEIAGKLEISVKAVEKRMHKALKYLAEQNILKKR